MDQARQWLGRTQEASTTSSPRSCLVRGYYPSELAGKATAVPHSRSVTPNLSSKKRTTGRQGRNVAFRGPWRYRVAYSSPRCHQLQPTSTRRGEVHWDPLSRAGYRASRSVTLNLVVQEACPRSIAQEELSKKRCH